MNAIASALTAQTQIAEDVEATAQYIVPLKPFLKTIQKTTRDGLQQRKTLNMVTKAELLVTNEGLQERNNDLMAAMSKMSHELDDVKKEIIGVREHNAVMHGSSKYIAGQLKVCQAVLRKANLIPRLDEEHPQADIGDIAKSATIPNEELHKKIARGY